MAVESDQNVGQGSAEASHAQPQAANTKTEPARAMVAVACTNVTMGFIDFLARRLPCPVAAWKSPQHSHHRESEHMNIESDPAPKLDRSLQLAMLQRLEAAHPDAVDLIRVFSDRGHNRDKVISNAMYLSEHGLIELGDIVDYTYDGKAHTRGGPMRIVARGRDFLKDDGGLSAVLGVVVIKLHDETLRAILESKIAASTNPESVKRHALKRLRELPGDAMRSLLLRVVEKGAEHLDWSFLQSDTGQWLPPGLSA